MSANTLEYPKVFESQVAFFKMLSLTFFCMSLTYSISFCHGVGHRCIEVAEKNSERSALAVRVAGSSGVAEKCYMTALAKVLLSPSFARTDSNNFCHAGRSRNSLYDCFLIHVKAAGISWTKQVGQIELLLQNTPQSKALQLVTEDLLDVFGVVVKRIQFFDQTVIHPVNPSVNAQRTFFPRALYRLCFRKVAYLLDNIQLR